jgi:hypothetical protein
MILQISAAVCAARDEADHSERRLRNWKDRGKVSCQKRLLSYRVSVLYVYIGINCVRNALCYKYENLRFWCSHSDEK